ncbi:MAG: hypothetical protein J0I82_25605 [Spirosoma sp.]|uniref:hypothetical protein n=2 Tax=unclassified Spirosoma TaxID=2621999 RepID=UPI001AC853CA|nr:hypothetical protein [Spirosoma sp.]MBN8825430.1 hypothetical protein [Spirosoma sp.]
MTNYRLYSIPNFLICFLVAASLTSCLTSRQTAYTLTKVASDDCAIDSSGTSGYVFHPVDLVPGSPDDSLLRRRYGERGLRMAQAVGLTSLLVQATLLEQQQKPNQPASNEYLTIRQKMTDQLQLASFDIATAVALVDCDSKRATLTATLLTRQENSREKRMTIGAITTGALTALTVGLLKLGDHEDAGEWVGIGGGLAEAGLGITSLLQKPPKADFQHQRNPLRDIWSHPATSTVFPPLVWYYLNKPKSGGNPSLIDALRSRWELLVSLNTEAKRSRRRKQEVDYFGKGDFYTAEDLTVRSTMLGQLATELQLMNNDLTILLNEIVRPAVKR